MRDLPCPFRFNLREGAEGQVATCGLIQQILRVKNGQFCDVPREACEACFGASSSAGGFANVVFPSLLNQAGVEYLESTEHDIESRTRVMELVGAAERAIVDDSFQLRKTYPSCDVFVYCTDASAMTKQSIESILDQEGAEVRVHLILADVTAEALVEAFENEFRIQFHRLDRPMDLFSSVQQLVPLASCDFIVLQDAKSVSLPNRIASVVASLQQNGGDFAGSSMTTPTGTVIAQKPTSSYTSSIPWPTLVFRRSSFIDIGGFAERIDDQADELIHRAFQGGSAILILPTPWVKRLEDWETPTLGTTPRYEPRFESLRHHGLGHPLESVQCDVVLPVYGQLEFVGPAIESIINQEGAEAVIHLIDDQSPESTDELFRYWGTHRQVRLYRNTKNIGQYASFNNASEFFETKFAAVQDGDDISLPHRLQWSVNMLRLCGGELFAAAVKVFGEEELIRKAFPENVVRRSCYPRPSKNLWFTMNPSTCFRVSMFRRLGGYGHYGAQLKFGLDTEFMTRAYYSGVRFTISNQVVTNYRVHSRAITRRSDTGFGSERRRRATIECIRRRDIFSQVALDPQALGGLGVHRGVTQRTN